MLIAETKKYYWLKLQKDFFQQDDMQFLETVPDGKLYMLFYIQLLAKAIDREGVLRYSQKTPYTPAMLGRFTGNDAAFVEQALAVLEDHELIERRPDGTIFMCRLENMVGVEATSTERVRRHRERKALQETEGNVSSAFPGNTEIEKESEIESDTESDLYPEKEEDLSPFGGNRGSVKEESAREAVSTHTAAPQEGENNSFGAYGWVRLKNGEFSQLVSDLGFEETMRSINYLDEMAQSTNNKNQWKDWNVVIRRCSREGWGLGRERSAGKNKESFLELLQRV